MSIATTISTHREPSGAIRTSPKTYWDARARRYALSGAGLAAVCSYGMPLFYNGYIHLLQLLALRRWLRIRRDARVLEVGCGIGRWTRRVAGQGGIVTGLDLALTMVQEAQRRSIAAGLHDRSRFIVADVCQPCVQGQFDLIFGVTVLQHVMDEERFETALAELAVHLAPGGRMILLEAAPSTANPRCDSAIFYARDEATYRRAFARAGLRCVAMTGVDPMPLKTWFLPWYRRLPRPLALAGLLILTVASLPVDVVLGRQLARASWHKVFVLTSSAEDT